jgi:hypothetical protein
VSCPRRLAALVPVLLALGCSGPESAPEVPLGPADGRELPGVALDRIQVGESAPDFTLDAFRGGRVTLSDFRGRQDVLLVFYRGHW